MTSPTTEQRDVAAIAKGLTKAQADAVQSAPPSWFNLPSNHPMTAALRSCGLVRSYHHQFAHRYSMCLTPTGLALRQHLNDIQGANNDG